MELGECSGAAGGEQPPLGELQVKVVSKGKGRAIVSAEVTATVDRHGKTSKNGTVTFKKLSHDAYDVRVLRRYPDQDWISFHIHYPAVTSAHEATGRGHESVTVNGSATLTVEIDYYRLLPGVGVFRNHIIWRPKPGDDKYGHWWTVIDGESYGWWPKYSVADHGPMPELPEPPSTDANAAARVQHMFSSMVARARRALFRLRNNAPVNTLVGVEGELNGVTSFGGTPTRDPHDINGDPGHKSYEVVVTDEEDDAAIKRRMRDFVRTYSGSWSWRFEFGQNCHTFQVGMLRAADIRRFRER